MKKKLNIAVYLILAMYVTGQSWVTGDESRNETILAGKNSKAGSFSIVQMKYFKYTGKNPFFDPESEYNTAGFKRTDGSFERFMERFVFYRFVGLGAGIANLDNTLIAVDTYTKLVFTYAKPVQLLKIFGFGVPQEWGPVDEHSTASDGKKHAFYEYDNIGYVRADGSVLIYDWAIEKIVKLEFDPRYTGQSPYYGGSASLADINPDTSGYLPKDSAQTNFTFLPSVFSVWLLHASFSSSNAPSYQFFEPGAEPVAVKK